MIRKKAKEVIRKEAEAVAHLEKKIDQSFEKAVELILKCKGRVIVTGIGKSGIIGKKIAATLTSTGTASFFLHPTEGIHGDLG
ncbi:MAG: SIS domain-containing protein, partial [Candidatus Zixiibacteriota bacterium]